VTKEYRQIEYALVQGVGGHLWKWSASVAGEASLLPAHSRSPIARLHRLLAASPSIGARPVVPPKSDTCRCRAFQRARALIGCLGACAKPTHRWPKHQ
jgi:hypothetical protein